MCCNLVPSKMRDPGNEVDCVVVVADRRDVGWVAAAKIVKF